MASYSAVNEVVGEDVLAVAAIDFGTTYTGYAVSFKGDEKNIITGKHGSLLEQERVPTNVLLNPDETFNSFGYEAENNYSKLKPEERKRHLFFKTFKMELYKSKTLSRSLLLVDYRGRRVKALDIFSMVIWYLKDLVLQTMKISKLDIFQSLSACSGEKRTENGSRNKGSIQWMVSVPAIWPDEARQFMRAAAQLAEIDEENLRLVLEPEAASLYCREQPVQIKSSSVNVLSKGHKYILADLGGGTADICVHEIIENNKLRELYRATGGDLGGTRVEFEFNQFLIKLVGGPVFVEFQDRYMSKYLKLMRSFKQERERFSSSTEEVHISLEYQLIRLLNDAGETLQDLIQNTRFASLVEYDVDEQDLILKPELMRSFFSSSLDGIISLLNEIVQECSEDKIETLLLVGGYSECQYVREEIIKMMKSLRVVLQPDARLAVLKGTVLMGYMPKNIIQRRSKFSYGISLRTPFIEGVHPEKLKIVTDTGVFCTKTFRKLIEKDEVLEYEQIFIAQLYLQIAGEQNKRNEKYVQLYRSSRKTPKYCTPEEDCVWVGTLRHKPPPEGWPDYMEASFYLMVGETEFLTIVENTTTGQKDAVYMDFI